MSCLWFDCTLTNTPSYTQLFYTQDPTPTPPEEIPEGMITTPYGDIIPEDSEPLMQQITLGSLALVTYVAQPLKAPTGAQAVTEGASRLATAIAALGVSCMLVCCQLGCKRVSGFSSALRITAS